MISITDADRRARLARRHRLLPTERVDDVAAIADSLVALHSSDPVTVYLAVAARSHDLSPDDVDTALYDRRSVIRHHAMRRTLWVTTTEVAELAHAACTRKIAAAERAKSAAFVGDEAWFDAAVARAVEVISAAESPVTTRQLGELAPELRREIVYGDGTRHRATGSAHTRAALVAAFEGALLRGRPLGSWVSSQYAWVPQAQWVGIDWARHRTADGASGLVGRWLERFGPGTLDDIVWWTGTTKTFVRAALGTLDVTEVELSTGTGYVLAGDDHTDRRDGETAPWVAVLPGLDPTAMGWKQRSWYLDDDTAHRVIDRFGNIGPTVWADGRIVGGWAQRPDGTLATELTGALTPAHDALLDAELRKVESFIGDARFRVRFPSPNQADLLA